MVKYVWYKNMIKCNAVIKCRLFNLREIYKHDKLTMWRILSQGLGRGSLKDKYIYIYFRIWSIKHLGWKRKHICKQNIIIWILIIFGISNPKMNSYLHPPKQPKWKQQHWHPSVWVALQKRQIHLILKHMALW